MSVHITAHESTFRFFHADYLRLGTPLAGLADAPTWLRQLATGASRQAVRNLVEAAVTKRVSFVLIAGSIADDRDDLESAVNWLVDEFETLRRHQIAVVVVADDDTARNALSRCCDLVVRSTESLLVNHSNGTLRIDAASGVTRQTDLLIDVGRCDFAETQGMVYHAAASQQRSSSANAVSDNGRLSLSAGVLQSRSVSEPGSHGCLLVEADVVHRQLRSQFEPCDVLRYCAENIDLGNRPFRSDLVSAILDGSSAFANDEGRTLVADWTVDGEFEADVSNACELSEHSLASVLRDHLNSGHKGLWLRKLNFADGASVRLTQTPSPVFDEYMRTSPEDASSQPGVVSYRAQSRSMAEVVAGLSFLSRVA